MVTPRLINAVDTILKEPRETSWIEFKENSADFNYIARCASALANSAALAAVDYGFLIWGVRDADLAIVGTHFDPESSKLGNQALLPWLSAKLKYSQGHGFHEQQYGGHRLVILAVNAARHEPTVFDGHAYIRNGPHVQKLVDHPHLQRELWKKLLESKTDRSAALQDLTDHDILNLLDSGTFLTSYSLSPTTSPQGIIARLLSHRLIERHQGETWSIPVFSALAFARDLADFPVLERKSIRAYAYDSDSRLTASGDFSDTRGYASSFPELMRRIKAIMPQREIVEGAYRYRSPMIPEIAISEVLANALIHQDLEQAGTGPIVEVFSNRVEITSPGEPLISKDRLIDAAPRSRNEQFARLMRDLDFCDERGSGWDKVADVLSSRQLPGPTIEVTNEQFRVILWPHRPFSDMSVEDRIWAVYLHACWLFVAHKRLNNGSVRDRFGLSGRSGSTAATRLLNAAVDAELLILADPHAPRNQIEYVPYWAE